jgi:Spy/CpxP family protein refolding chaperone
MNTVVLTAIAAVLVVASVSSAHAVTCQDVRDLSAAEQDYWSARLNLTSAQRQQIWAACYGRHFRARLGDHTRGLPAEGQRDVSAAALQ